MTELEETTGVANMVLLENCDDKKLIENLKKRLQKNIIYVRSVYLLYIFCTFIIKVISFLRYDISDKLK